MEATPYRILSKEEFYAYVDSQNFIGPAFQNAKKITMWSDRIEALIHVPASSDGPLDGIRKLDPCLHLFGLISQFMKFPDWTRGNYYYLSNSLQGFVVHSETLPSEFNCRYYLPAETGKNYVTSSVSFDVFTLSGELLISCEKYSVAQVPKGLAIQTPVMDTLSRKWMQNTWRREDAVVQGFKSSGSFARGETVVYFSNSINSAVLSTFAPGANEIIIGELGVSDYIRYTKTDPDKLADDVGSLVPSDTGLEEELDGKGISIVLDVTGYHAPGTAMCAALWKYALWLMKFALSDKVDVSAFVVPPRIGTVLQGMLRVYRRESGLSSDAVWGVDLPNQLSAEALSAEAVSDILSKEIHMRSNALPSKSTVVAYRRAPRDGSIVRLVPVLLPKAEERNAPTRSIDGLVVIVGMGSIGQALAGYLGGSGCRTIVFMGRRSADDNEASITSFAFDYTRLAKLKIKSSFRHPGVCPDRCHRYEGLRSSMDAVVSRFGDVKHVVYTAAVVRDATVLNVSNDEFASVLDSKAVGAWNMHLISQEMKWNLDTFVLLSSISVPLGKEGQVAYVAVLQSLSEKDPVQVIVNWNAEKMAQIPAYGSDAMFCELWLNIASKERVVQKTYSRKELSENIVRAVKDVLRSKEVIRLIRRNPRFMWDGLHIVCADARECAAEIGY
ncbi:KR domain-containing protein [Cyathus striatus]|nr:KR domain-containing protein [Cyathus striatus]